MNVDLKILAVALLSAAALGMLLAFLTPLPAETPPPQTGADGPAPADVSALIEEAKRITGEAA